MARRIFGKMPRWRVEGTWEYPPLGDAMRAYGIKEIETYISRLNSMVVQYIATHPIMYLCLDMGSRPVLQAPKRLGNRRAWYSHGGRRQGEMMDTEAGMGTSLGKEMGEGSGWWERDGYG